MSTRSELGREGEAAAEAFLRRRGYAILARNVRCRSGEIDLVARDGQVVVFVEVRGRRSRCCGGALESVDRRKRVHLVRAAREFIAARGLGEVEARFDVVGVTWDAGRPCCEHVMDAFLAG